MEAGVRDPWSAGRAFEPECPLCSGTTKRNDPAAQALDWGVRTAEAKGHESEFWDVMLAAEMFRAAPGSQIPADEDELDLSVTVRRGTQIVSKAVNLLEGPQAREGTLTYSLDTRSPPGPTRRGSEDEPERVPVVTLPDTPTPWFYVPGGGVHKVPPTRLRDSWSSCCCFFKRIGFLFFKLPAKEGSYKAILQIQATYQWAIAPKYKPCMMKWEERTTVTHLVPPASEPAPDGRTTVPQGPGGTLGEWTDVTRHLTPKRGAPLRMMDPGAGACDNVVPFIYQSLFRDEPGGPAKPARLLQIRVTFWTGCEGPAVAGNSVALIFTQRTSTREHYINPETGKKPEDERVVPPWPRAR